jgi:2-keto-4-pentenoate hydratase/2-oxohepta-3-ene-1,7-dioic acid hydratase in catechol pathway
VKLAAVRARSDTQLHVFAGRGYLALAEAAEALGIPGLTGISDVAELYRSGQAAVRSAQRVAEGAAGLDLPQVLVDDLVLDPPVRHPASIVCIGRNYREHIKEGNVPVPDYPILFSKFPNTLVGSGAPIRSHAQLTQQLDYEGELGVLIGRRASGTSATQAWSVVAGYTILNDVSARDLQYQDLQWIRGKSLDSWCPLGPVFVSSDEIPNPDELRIQTQVNGELRQNASCGDMLFKIPELIEFITQGITLEPGDIVATGTPSGVGMGFNPPRWLHPGDRVEVTIEPIGTLRSLIVE